MNTDEIKFIEENFSSEEKFKTTFHQAAVGIAVVALDGRFLQVNEKFSLITGYSIEELLSLRYQDLTYPEDIKKDEALSKQLLNGVKYTSPIEKRYICKNKKIKWIQLTVGAITEGSRPKYFISVIEDIDDRKKIEHELNEYRSKLEIMVSERTAALNKKTDELNAQIKSYVRIEKEVNKFFELSRDGIVVIDAESKFKKVNTAFTKMLGYTADELIGKLPREFLHPEDLAAALDAKTQLFEKQNLDNYETRYLAKDGSIVYISWSVTVLKEEGLVYGIAKDITEIKKMQKEIHHEKQKVVKASKMNALGTMASGIAHEINNPLTIIYGQALLLKDSMVNDKEVNKTMVLEASQQIVNMSERMVKIINGLRTFASDTSRSPMQFISLQSIIDETTLLCARKLKMEGIEFVFPTNCKLEVYGNSVELSQILLNLINNARDAVQLIEKPRIEIGIYETKMETCFYVKDNGIGIPKEYQQNLFQPFFTTKEIGKGTGLGLSITKGLVDSHFGSIEFSEAKPKGAKFTIRLPKVN